MPALYCERDIPGYIKTEDEAIEYECSVAKKSISLWSGCFYPGGNTHIDQDRSIVPWGDITKKEKSSLF